MLRANSRASFCFFFSRRRRHTRLTCDWSSDVCSSDLALATLDAVHPPAFDGMFADLRGDALAAAGRVADARTAYETALAKLDAKSAYRNFVQVKHDALGAAAAATSAAPAPAAATAGTPPALAPTVASE